MSDINWEAEYNQLAEQYDKLLIENIELKKSVTELEYYGSDGIGSNASEPVEKKK